MSPTRIIGPADGLRRVFLRNLEMEARIGIYPHEHAAAQRIRVNVEMGVRDDVPDTAPDGVGPDELPRVVDYERVAEVVRRIVRGGHVRLVETLAERIASAALRDDRVLLARVRVEKLDVFPDAESAGVEVERRRAGDSSTPAAESLSYR
jgi:dihydroneopterin aldolase